MPYRVCSISGGGIRGIIPATIIQEMLEISKSLGENGDIRDLCDYVVGTSVGGIVGAALVASKDKTNPKFKYDEILSLLQSNAAVIFPEDANHGQQIIFSSIMTGISAIGSFIGLKILGLGMVGATAIGGVIAASTFGIAYKYSHVLDGVFASKYSRDGIDKLLAENFGELKLSDVVLPFTTVSYSLEHENPRVWSTLKANKVEIDNLFIKDALGATSAAPTFFPYKVTKVTTTSGQEETYYDIDGGIFANSPVNLAIAVLLKHSPTDIRSKIEKEGITVLSIGTGYHKTTDSFIPPTSFEQGKLGYGLVNPLVLKVMDASERDSIIQARYIHKTIRLDPKLAESLMPMDKSDPEHVKSLSKAASDFVIEHKEIIKGYVKCMISDTDCKELITESTPDYSYEIVI